jgi:chaperonin GroES
MQIRPIRDFLLVQPEPLEETTKGGLVIPKTAKQKHMFAKVLAVGPGRVTERGRIEVADVKVGDRVVLSAHNMGQRVDRLGEDGPMLVPEMDIEAIIE